MKYIPLLLGLILGSHVFCCLVEINEEALRKMYHEIACVKAGIIAKKNNAAQQLAYRQHLEAIQKCPLTVDANGIYYITDASRVWSLYVPKIRVKDTL